MKHHRHSLLTALCLAVAAPGLLQAVPVQIAQESFEGAPGAIGFTTSVPQFIELGQGNTQSDYFSIIPNNGTKVSGSRTLPGGDGASIFAAEDCDTTRTAPALAGPQEVSLTTNSVSIAGKVNTQVRLLMAAPGRQDAVTNNLVSLPEYENFLNAPLFINKLKVEASIDGGAFQRVVQFSPSVVNVSSQLSYDADGNNIGNDANPIPTNPTTLDATLREGIYAIPTGNTVQVRITVESDGTGELICFDNIRIFGEGSATAAPVLAGVPTGNLVFTEGGAAAAIAPALTVTDADSANLTSATVSISTGYVNGEDVLTATPSGAIVAGDIVFNATTGVLTITRSATKATYQTVLRSVSYRNTITGAPSTALRRVTFQTTDGTNPSNSPIRDITVVDAIALQSLPFVESWETDGRGSRYSVEGGFSSPPSMFARVQPGAVSGLDGTFAWGVENVDNNSDFTEVVTFNLNTAGLVNLTGELRVAAGGGPNYDNHAVEPDFLRVEASADGGPFVNVLAFYPDAEAQGNMRQDTTPGNATNLGDGTLLTAALQNFTFALPTATTLTVRIRAFTDIVGENILFDRLVVNLPPIIVTNTNDAGPGSLRQAIAGALAQAGANVINFDPSLNGKTIPLVTGLTITDTAGVTIDASSLPDGITLSGQDAVRVLLTQAGSRTTLIGLTISHGIAPAGAFNSGGGGGGIHNRGTLDMLRCTVSDNDVQPSATLSTAAGGIANHIGTLSLVQCTIANNSGDNPGGGGVFSSSGGGLWINSGTVSLLHCTVSGNNPQGIYNGATTLTMENSVVSGNTGGDTSGSGVTRVGTNFIGVNSGVAGTGPAALTGDAKLGPLARNGGPTATMHPLPGSPLRDRIATTSATTDQRGVSRPQWGAADIGAVEAGIQADCAWEVRDVFTSPVTTLGNLANVDAMLANPAATQVTGIVPVINFRDLNGQPGGGGFFNTGDVLFLSDNLTPQGVINQDDDSFATQARAFITITTAGDYTFGFSSDDGARLRLYSTTGGANPAFTSSTRLNPANPANPAHSGNTLAFDAPTGNSDTLGVVPLTPGVYGVEFTMWEDTGGASGEVFFASGARTAVDANFTLLGGNSLTRTPGIARPLNDNFAAAIPLSGAVVHAFGCNAGATMEPGEPFAIPGYDPVVYPRTWSVWWTWTAPATGGYQVDTIGSGFDTELAILTGTAVNALSEKAYDSDSGGAGFTSKLSFGAVAGTVYRIQVSGFPTGVTPGLIQLNIGPPANFAPSFTIGANQTALTNAGVQTVSNWATNISAGAPWETTQSVNFTVTTTNPSVFLVAPAISPSGTLTYTPSATNAGLATVSVTLVDNGSPVLSSATLNFTINVVSHIVTNNSNAGVGSLRACIAAVSSATVPTTIVFAPTFTGTITLTTGELVLTTLAPITIDATNLPAGVTISGGNASRIFRVTSGTTVTLKRLKLTSGNGVGGGTPAIYGGAIHTAGNLTLSECTLSGNSTGVGAAIYNAAPGVLTIDRSTLSGNTASNVGGAIQNESTLVATYSTFANNTATSEGGAISAPFGKPVTLKHCTVSGNTVTSGTGNSGGLKGTALSIENSIISTNTATTDPNLTAGFISTGVNIIAGSPGLLALGNYGGPTPTVPLSPTSPARNTATVIAPVPSIDQRGFPIVGVPDIGAYEAGNLINYNAWQIETFPATATTPQRAASFDFDGDGRSNLLEYATQTNGSTNDPPAPVTLTQTGGLATITLPIRPGATDLLYTLERSILLNSWTPAATYNPANNATTAISGVTFVTQSSTNISFQDTFATGQVKLFYRWKIVQQ